MANRATWSKERKLGVAAVAALIVCWVILLSVQTFTSVCSHSVGLFVWPLILTGVAASIAVSWAAVKDKWWWALGLLPAILLLLSVLGTFEGC